jgi:hypothetical protein
LLSEVGLRGSKDEGFLKCITGDLDGGRTDLFLRRDATGRVPAKKKMEDIYNLCLEG